MHVTDTVARPVRGIRALSVVLIPTSRRTRSRSSGSCGFMLAVLLELLARRTDHAATFWAGASIALSFATTFAPVTGEATPSAQTVLSFPRRNHFSPVGSVLGYGGGRFPEDPPGLPRGSDHPKPRFRYPADRNVQHFVDSSQGHEHAQPRDALLRLTVSPPRAPKREARVDARLDS